MNSPPYLPPYWRDAIDYLSKKDKVLKRIISQTPKDSILTRRSSPIEVLARSIVSQQISVKAADSIWDRIISHGTLTADSLLSQSEEELRRYGLSTSKSKYIHNVAEFVTEVGDDFFHTQDAEIIKESLLQIKGIGEWTYNMFAIFYLLEPNIFPLNDIALIRSIQHNYNLALEKDALVAHMRTMVAKWSPYNTVVCWYLWHTLDADPVNY